MINFGRDPACACELVKAVFQEIEGLKTEEPPDKVMNDAKEGLFREHGKGRFIINTNSRKTRGIFSFSRSLCNRYLLKSSRTPPVPTSTRTTM